MTEIVDIWEGFIAFLSTGGTFNIFGNSIPIYGIYAIILAIGLLIVLNLILKRLFQRLVNRYNLPPNVYNGIKFFLRIFFVSFITWLVLTFIGADPAFIWIIIGILTTALTFASMKAINNFIAGIWIAINRPYIVGDYVKIGNVEGIIKNITTTYTQIIHNDATISFIPNTECLSGAILNYTWSVSLIQEKISNLEKNLNTALEIPQLNEEDIEKNKRIQMVGQIRADIEEQKLVLKEITAFEEELEKLQQTDQKQNQNFSNYAQKGKIVKYVFTLKLPKDYEKNADKLSHVCTKWAQEFDFRPQWDLINITSHFNYQFTIITPNPLDIVNYQDDFVTDVYRIIYKK